MWTLIQNQRVISQNGRTLEATIQSLELQKIATSNAISQLQIEEETRLNPELECAYNPYGGDFVIRNVGTMAAENIFLQTKVFSVLSNEVLELTPISRSTGTILPPLEKSILLPGEIAKANQVYVPDTQEMAAFWGKFGGEILVRVYVTYERSKPAYHRYSGFFNFTLSGTPKFDADARVAKSFLMLLTEEEKPMMQKTLEQFNAMPRDQFKTVAWFGTNDMGEMPSGPGDFGVGSIVGATSNGVFILGSWAKHH
jgi:hypothetical protein